MLFILGFLILQILVTFMLKDFIPAGEAYGIILLLTSIIAISLYLYRTLEKEWLLLIFGGFVIRVIVLFIDLYVPSLPIFSSGTDTEYFHEISIIIANGMLPVSEGATAYVPFLSGLYYLIGDQRPFAQFLNVAFWVFAAVYLLKSLKYIGAEKKITFIVLLIFTLMPNSIFMSSILLRESIIIFFITISLYHFLKWFSERKFSDFLLAIGLALISMIFHSGMVGFVAAYILTFIFLSRETIKKNFSHIFLYMLFFLVLSFLLFQNAELFLSKFVGLEERGGKVLEISGAGDSMYLSSFNGMSGAIVFLVAPIKMFFFLFSPLPLDWRGMGDIVSFLFDSSIYLFLTGAIVFGLWKSKMPLSNKIFILLFLALTVVVYSYGTQSAGTAMRHRNKIIPLLLLAFAISNNKQLIKLNAMNWKEKKGEKIS